MYGVKHYNMVSETWTLDKNGENMLEALKV